MQPDDRLDSWKEIAAYLKRSVRTVRRWEHEEALPVHRHLHHTHGTVYAHKSELEAWRQRSSRAPAAPIAATKSIAVLPFANLSNDADNEYFADGLTDEVTTNLSRLRALRVISGTSARRFRNSASGAKAIAAQLGVRFLLEGGVRRAGERLRISAQLIDAASDDHIWAETYDGTIDDIFAIQERLARVIVDALEVHLTADEEQTLARRPIDNLPAYDCYLRARHEGWRWRQDAIDRAVHLLQDALDIMGDNARLYAALGRAYLQYREAGIDLSERPLVEADRCTTKVFALEPSSAAGMQLRGWIHYSRGNVRQAVRDLEASLEREPNDADTLLLLSNCYLISGRVAAARPLIARVLEIDPLTPVTRCMPAYADIVEGNVSASAIAAYRQMFEMDESNPMGRLFYAYVLALSGNNDEMRAIGNGFAPDVRGTLPARVAMFIAGGEPPTDIAVEQTASDVFPRLLAYAYARAGMADEAIRWLQIAVDRGFINYPFLAEHDPSTKSLRRDPRFTSLLARVRERWEQFDAT